MILSDDQITENLSALRGWEYINNQIQKTYLAKDFSKAMELVNQIAMIAEQANHHPDINIQYNKVTFALSTHSEGGVTDKDFKMAGQIEQAMATSL